jgi:hypothetical protein
VRLAAALALAGCAPAQPTPAEPAQAEPVTVALVETKSAPIPAVAPASPAPTAEPAPDLQRADEVMWARARWRYHMAIVGYLRQGFTCPGRPAGATPCAPSATFTITVDGIVTALAITPCGDAAVDAAATAAATSKQGETIPPPPENYPELQLTSISVTYPCR